MKLFLQNNKPPQARLISKTKQIMRLTSLLFISLAFQVSASVSSQNVTFKGSNLSARKVLSIFKTQTNYVFFYQKEILKDLPPLSLDLKNATVETALKSAFANKPITWTIIDKTVFLAAKKTDPVTQLEMQQLIIKGKVTDEKGEPMAGVSLVVKGTKRATITDYNGEYSISTVDGKSVLIFSFIGFASQEILIGDQKEINVSLKHATKSLDEVIIVGYGSKKKLEVSGSISQVKGEVLKASPSPNLGASLAGRLAGVTVNQRNGQPGSDGVSIQVRGISSMTDSSALIVVDGIANRDGIGRLDPEDIETITVLKDASAAIYGSQAAGGVILVTTKRGNSGKPVFNFTTNQSFTSPTKLPRMADSYTYANALNEAEISSGRPQIYTADDLQKYKSGSSPLTHPNTNWYDKLFKSSALLTRNNLSVRGGGDKVKYFLSLGNIDQKGLYNQGNIKYNQYNVRSNVDAQITDNFKISLDLAYRDEKRVEPGYNQDFIFWMTLRQPPTTHAIFPNGSYSQGLAGINPLALVRESGYNKNDTDVFQGTLRLEYKIPKVPGLSFDGFLATDKYSNFGKQWTTPWDYSTWNPTTDTYQTFQSSYQGRITLGQDYSKTTSITYNTRVKYARKFGAHDINVFAAYEQNKSNTDKFATGRNSFSTEAIDELNAGTTNKEDYFNSGSSSEYAKQNYFGRVSYTFGEKYILDYNWRYDGSINFPKGDRFGFFQGVSAAWVISKEQFMNNNSFVQDLKLRASYGELGNDRIDPFQYTQKFSFTDGYVINGSNTNGISASGTPIKHITWETTTVSNLGLDASFFDKKLGLEFDVFKKTTKNMLISRQLAFPEFIGFSAPKQNAGTMENKGVELALNYRDVFGNFKFGASGNVSYVKNKMLYIDEAINPDAPWQAQTGSKLNGNVLYDAIGIFKTPQDLLDYPHYANSKLGDLIFRDVNNDKIINSLDRVRTDLNNVPEISFGLNLTTAYKNFDLSVLFQGQARVVQPIAYNFDGSANLLQSQLENAWSPTNPNGTYPRPGANNSYWDKKQSNFWLQDASFVRLKTIELGYSLPKDMLRKNGIEDLRLYVSGFNLLTLSKIKDQDPEITSTEGRAYPQTKIFNFGAKLTF
jgi:TonB-linked SusC/RagA family outer membrane protein